MGWVNSFELWKDKPPSNAEITQVEDYRKRGAKPRVYADENFPARATEILRAMAAFLVPLWSRRN